MMIKSFAARPVGQLVRERVDRSRVFERYGIDYCCGGDRSLGQACEAAGVEIEQVCQELEQSDRLQAADETDWSGVSLAELADHIVARHHSYLRTELPRISRLIQRVVAAHGDRDPRLQTVQTVFTNLVNELVLHMAKEEQVLFPIVQRMETAAAEGETLPRFHCGSVQNPIGVMEDEHRHAGEALADLRRLTDGYRPPAGACETYRALLAALAQLEQDMHLHIHKENNILFPGAAQLEAGLRANIACHDTLTTAR